MLREDQDVESLAHIQVTFKSRYGILKPDVYNPTTNIDLFQLIHAMSPILDCILVLLLLSMAGYLSSDMERNQEKSSVNTNHLPLFSSIYDLLAALTEIVILYNVKQICAPVCLVFPHFCAWSYGGKRHN